MNMTWSYLRGDSVLGVTLGRPSPEVPVELIVHRSKSSMDVSPWPVIMLVPRAWLTAATALDTDAAAPGEVALLVKRKMPPLSGARRWSASTMKLPDEASWKYRVKSPTLRPNWHLPIEKVLRVIGIVHPCWQLVSRPCRAPIRHRINARQRVIYLDKNNQYPEHTGGGRIPAILTLVKCAHAFRRSWRFLKVALGAYARKKEHFENQEAIPQ